MIGESVGGYQIVAKLGEGGMGVVYLGEHRRIARRAAIKVLRADLTGNEEMLARFFNEARATSMIRHPAIVEILDCDVLPTGDAYIVMELLEGESLAAALARDGAFAVPRALAAARQIADGLGAAHARGIVHRDLKPDNVFISASGSIKILDFGIAKLTNPELVGGRRMTHTGRLLGTPTYMSPEQCRGVRDVDARTDVYALGCMMFELVCRRPPFADAGFGELVIRHLTFVPPRLRSLDPSVPPGLDALVARMLAKDPAERPQTMREVVAELDRLVVPALAPARIKTPAPLPATVMMFSGPRIATPPAGSGAAAPRATARPATSAPTAALTGQTTLRSAASEHVVTAPAREAAPEEPADAELESSPRRRGRGGPVLALAALGAIAGVGTWRWQSAREAPRPAAASAPAAVASVVQPPPAAAPTPPAPNPPVPAPGSVNAEVEAPPARAPSPMKVKITITSSPSDADVCLFRDKVFLGRTRYEWTVDRGPRVAKLWVRRAGYHAEPIAVSLERDARKHVELTKLGPDDIADLDGCHR